MVFFVSATAFGLDISVSSQLKVMTCSVLRPKLSGTDHVPETAGWLDPLNCGYNRTHHHWGHGNVLAWPLGDSTGTWLNVPIYWQFTFHILINVDQHSVEVYDLFAILILAMRSI